MILDLAKTKSMTFSLDIDGADIKEHKSFLSIAMNNFNLEIPMVLEEGKLKVSIPPLKELKNHIPENKKLKFKIFSIIGENYFEPYESEMKVKEEPKLNIEPDEEKEEKEEKKTIDEKKEKSGNEKKENKSEKKTKFRAVLETERDRKEKKKEIEKEEVKEEVKEENNNRKEKSKFSRLLKG
jgi:hypothetical protein